MCGMFGGRRASRISSLPRAIESINTLTVRELRPRSTYSDSNLDGAGPRGWGIACLDPQCFRSTENRFTTFGCSMPRPSMRHSATFWDNTACIRNVSDASRFHPGMIELGCVPGVRQHLSSQRDDSLDSQQLELVDEPDSDTDTNASDEDTDEGHSGSVEGHRAPPEVDQPLGVGPMDQGPDTSEVSRWEASANLTGCMPTLKDFSNVLYSQHS